MAGEGETDDAEELNRLRALLGESVWIDPGRQGGTPCVGGTRIPVPTVVAHLEAAGEEATLRAYPSLTAGSLAAVRWYWERYGEAGCGQTS